MGRRSRHSAKSGDQAMYKSRTSSSRGDNNNGDGSDDDDQMYDEVDRFHNRKEEAFLQLDGHDDESDDDSSDDDGITKGKEGVFDLGVGGSSDEESDDDDDGQQEMMAASRSKKAAAMQLASSSDDDDSDDDDDDDEKEKKSNLLNWGAKKHSYYHGDTADLEIGQDVDDALLEEEAAYEVEKARLEDMEEGDFMLDGDEDDEVVEEKPKKKRKQQKSSKQEEAEDVETIQSIKNTKQISKLSKKDKIKLLKANHPELLPLVQHFSGSVQDLVDSTMVAGGALLKNGAKAGRKEAQVCSLTVYHCMYKCCLCGRRTQYDRLKQTYKSMVDVFSRNVVQNQRRNLFLSYEWALFPISTIRLYRFHILSHSSCVVVTY
jgi:U3 small nucleolar RNA-associated protein 3